MTSYPEKYQKRRIRRSYISVCVSISLVLFLIAIQGLILIYAQKLSNYVRENIGFTIVLNDAANEADVARLQKQLDFSSYVKSTEFISKEQAASQLSEDLGEEFIEFLDYNPIAANIEVRLHAAYANPDSMQVLEAQMLHNSVVSEVYYQKNLVQMVNDNIRRISIVILSIALLTLLIAIALISNTIRMAIYSRRLSIRSMQLVGATRGFISRPFIWRGLLQGLIGAMVAIILTILCLCFLQQRFPMIVSLQDIDSFLLLFVGVIVVGLLFAFMSSLFAVRRFLNMEHDKIYF